MLWPLFALVSQILTQPSVPQLANTVASFGDHWMSSTLQGDFLVPLIKGDSVLTLQIAPSSAADELLLESADAAGRGENKNNEVQRRCKRNMILIAVR
jgi:hypothetical protein